MFDKYFVWWVPSVWDCDNMFLRRWLLPRRQRHRSFSEYSTLPDFLLLAANTSSSSFPLLLLLSALASRLALDLASGDAFPVTLFAGKEVALLEGTWRFSASLAASGPGSAGVSSTKTTLGGWLLSESRIWLVVELGSGDFRGRIEPKAGVGSSWEEALVSDISVSSTLFTTLLFCLLSRDAFLWIGAEAVKKKKLSIKITGRTARLKTVTQYIFSVFKPYNLCAFPVTSGIHFTKQWRAENLQPGLRLDNFKT